MPKLLVIDAMAGLYRSYFAMARMPLTTPRGMNVAALYGFVNTLFALIEREQPDLLVVCTDTPEPTFRHEAYGEYKATRDEMPEDLQTQVPLLYQLLETMRIKVLQAPGFEADDLMATLATRAAKEGFEPIIVSADKDLAQLLQFEKIRILSPSRTTAGQWNEITAASVQEKYGIPPERLGDWLAMVGDTSDNVPGIPKIGDKSATELLKTFGSLDNILSDVEKIEKKSWRETIAANSEQAKLSRFLVELRFDAPVPDDISALTFGPFAGSDLQQLLNELGFRALLKKVVAATSSDATAEERHYETVNTVAQLEAMIQELDSADFAALDTETTGLDPNQANLVGISISIRPQHAWFVHLPSFEGFSSEQTEENATIVEGSLFGELSSRRKLPAQSFVIEQLRPWLENPAKRKCGQNFKYDALIFYHCGVEVAGWSDDPMLMSYLLDPNSRSHGIDLLSQKYLNLPKIPTEALIGSGKNQRSMVDVPIEKITEYAGEDADYTRRLAILLRERLEEEKLTHLQDEIELPLAKVLYRIERTGIRIDPHVLAQLSHTFASEQMKLEAEVHRLVGHPFNLGSPAQLAKILFEELKLKPVRKTKTGYSTDEDVLQKLTHQDPSIPIPGLVLRYRMLSKLRGTYVDALPKLINPTTGRVHTSFNQAVASTGRLSSTDPNLQNIPIRSEEGALIRTAFVAGHDGWKILSADYSQIELRLMAHLSGDETLREAFKLGLDIHAATAAKVFGIPLSEVTREQRSVAKGVNFGIIYGQTDFGLSEALSIPMDEAKSFRKNYFATYPGVRAYMDSTVDFAREHGYVATLYGRKRPIPEIHADNRATREFAERIAINTPIQGTAADVLKIAMINVDAKLEKLRLEKHFQAKMLLTVHDELVFETPPEELDELSELVKREMEQAVALDVPLVADLGVGNNWLEAH
ncbi:MAG: DNA polymerase I [bacterium]|nr:DNA polymerase I [bacterium]